MSMHFAQKQTSLPYDGDDYRAYLIRRNAPLIVHHSVGQQFKRLRVTSRRFVRAVGDVLHRGVLTIQAAKMRRIERELRMHGISCKWADDTTPIGTAEFNRPE